MKKYKLSLLLLFLLILFVFGTFLIIQNTNKEKSIENANDTNTDKQKSIENSINKKKDILLLCHSKILNSDDEKDNEKQKNEHKQQPYDLYNIDKNDNITYLDIYPISEDTETLKYDLTEMINVKNVKNFKNRFNLILDVHCDGKELFKTEQKIHNLIKNILFFLKENGKCYINVQNIKGINLEIKKISDDNLKLINKSMGFKFNQPSNPLEIFLEELNKIKTNNEYSFKYYILDEVYGNKDYDINIKNKKNIQSTKIKNDKEKFVLFEEKKNPTENSLFSTTFVIIKD